MSIIDITAFNKFFTENQERFIQFAYMYVKDRAIAEDFTLEAMMHFWEDREKLNPDSNISAYVLTIIKRKCLNHLQRLQVSENINGKLKDYAEWELSVRISSLDACNPSELFTSEAEEIVNNTLASLPEQTRRIFEMNRFESKTYKEIAVELGITAKGVEYHISNALKKLQRSLRDYITLLFI